MDYNQPMPHSLKNFELVWIDQPQQLRHAAEELAAQEILAIDTESNSLYAYQEQVCLVQISTRLKDYLIDARALPDLSPLAEIFNSDRILKVFHAAEYDLICLFRDYGFRFNFIFDTMLAARILGFQQVGLGALLEKYFNVQMNKKYQRADWGKRPLKPEMLEYARQDSHYLIALQEQLRAELLAADLLDLAVEDFTRLTIGIEDTTETCADDFWKIHGARDLSPEKAAVLKALYNFRQAVAKAQNKPLFKILSNQALIELATACPKHQADLLERSTLHERQVRRYGPGLLVAVQEGLQAPPEHPPNHVRPRNSVLNRMEILQEWRKETGKALGVPSDVVMPRDVLCRIARANPRDLSTLKAQMFDVPYRFNRFGQDMLSVIMREGLED
jgi:ribonuclease D